MTTSAKRRAFKRCSGSKFMLRRRILPVRICVRLADEAVDALKSLLAAIMGPTPNSQFKIRFLDTVHNRQSLLPHFGDNGTSWRNFGGCFIPYVLPMRLALQFVKRTLSINDIRVFKRKFNTKS